MRPLVLLGLLVAAAAPVRAASLSPVEKGTFTFRPLDDQKDVPPRFRLDDRTFAYEMERKTEMRALGVTVYRLRFPSPVKSATPENNTVHAEYYRPDGSGPFPGVIVLDITAGNQMLSRHIATYLARNKVAALFVQMAYYGPRRPPGSRLRLMSPNIPHTIAAVTQTVLDLRAAAAWMASRPELDADRLGITGTSLGSFLSALAGEMEPRLKRVCVLLGGGGFIDGYLDHPIARPYLQLFQTLGVSTDEMKRFIAPVDPITCAANLKKRRLLILAASRDEIVPPKMAQMLWEASGRQKIVWYDATHYSAALQLADGLEQILDHFKAP
ncbi:MAG: alpha/beta hydrolase family protein [Gemmataceae bacterium]